MVVGFLCSGGTSVKRCLSLDVLTDSGVDPTLWFLPLCARKSKAMHKVNFWAAAGFLNTLVEIFGSVRKMKNIR